MNKPVHSVAFAAIALLSAACQPQAKPAAVVRTQPPAAAPALPAPAAVSERLDTPAGWVDTKVGAPLSNIQAFLAKNNLAPLWQADFGRDDPGSSRPTILDGFYGTEHRHIAFIFDYVEQDAGQPNLFRVQGRSRFRKNILPFAGTITVEAIKAMKVFLDLDSAELAKARAYTATARFVLQEDSTAAGAGTFRGTALLDFSRLASGKLDLVQSVQVPDVDAPAKGSGVLFRGAVAELSDAPAEDCGVCDFSSIRIAQYDGRLLFGRPGRKYQPQVRRIGLERDLGEQRMVGPAHQALAQPLILNTSGYR